MMHQDMIDLIFFFLIFFVSKAEDGREIYSVKNSSEVSMLCSLGMQEEEELHMLASLCRQKEEDSQEGASWPAGLSASQIHNCTVSISSISDETSTWMPSLHMVSPVPLPVTLKKFSLY